MGWQYSQERWLPPGNPERAGLFMLPDSESPIRRASQRRFSAWTLYARAFVGNRADADDIVRKAVNRALRTSDDLRSERHAHERVLGAIRTEALELLKRRQVVASHDTPADELPVATPSVPTVTGERYFCINQDGVIFYSLSGPFHLNDRDCGIPPHGVEVGK